MSDGTQVNRHWYLLSDTPFNSPLYIHAVMIENDGWWDPESVQALVLSWLVFFREVFGTEAEDADILIEEALAAVADDSPYDNDDDLFCPWITDFGGLGGNWYPDGFSLSLPCEDHIVTLIMDQYFAESQTASAEERWSGSFGYITHDFFVWFVATNGSDVFLYLDVHSLGDGFEAGDFQPRY